MAYPNSTDDDDLYLERLASELEAIAQAVCLLGDPDHDLAASLMEFAHQIRVDSGLAAPATLH